MPQSDQLKPLALWQRASEAKLGIAVSTNDRQLLKEQLYRARYETGGFENIAIILPLKETELWLVKKNADAKGTD